MLAISLFCYFLNLFYFKLIFFLIKLDDFDILISKINLKNKKYYFNIFLNKKYFKTLYPGTEKKKLRRAKLKELF
jgi:hypothetical protein